MITVSYGNFQFLNTSGYTVPLVSISTDYQRNGAGQTIGGTNNINLEGKIILPLTGIGSTSGLPYLLAKESELRQVFSMDGYALDINGVKYSGIKVARYNTEKTENNWTNYINYSIDLVNEIDSTGNGSGCFLVSSTQDEWSVDFDGEASFAPSISMSNLGFSGNTPSTGVVFPLYRITRTLSAVGKYTPGKPNPDSNPISANSMPSGKSALENAEKWVKDHIDKFKVNNIVSGLNLYNFVRSVNKSDSEGSYRLSDTWLASNTGLADFMETFTVDSSLDESMIRTVTINGTVKGLEKFDPTKDYYYPTKLDNGGIKPTSKSADFRKGDDRFSNAISGYVGIKAEILNRARRFATTGIKYGSFSFPQNFKRVESPLNPIPTSSSETFNPLEGTINYSYSYTNRPSGIISGSITENITLNDKNSVPVIVSVPALFRSSGPLYQDLGTYTSSTRTVSITANFPRTGIAGLTFPPPQYSAISGMVERFNPTGLVQGIPGNTQFIKSYVKSDNMDWNVKDNSITVQKTWEWTISYIGVNNG